MANGLRWIDKVKGTGVGFFAVDIIAEEEKQSIFTWVGVPYILNTNMIDVFINGIFQQKTSYIERTGNSIEFINQIEIDKEDVICIRYRPSGYNLGNIRIVSTHSELDKLSTPIIGEIVFVQDERIFYHYTEDGVWKKLVSIVENVDEIESNYLYTMDIEMNQDNIDTNIINWDANKPYIMGIDMLDVYLNGQLLYREDFEEFTINSIKYKRELVPLILNDVITIKYRYTKISLGNIITVPNIENLEDVYMPIEGKLALVVTKKKIYKWNGIEWELFLDLGSGLIEITTINTSSLDLNYNLDILKGNVKLSEEIGNRIECKDDGLYMGASDQDGYNRLIVENVKTNDKIVINKAEEKYGLDGLGVFKIYEVVEETGIQEDINVYNEANKDKYIYDPEFVVFSDNNVSLKDTETVEMEYVRDLADGYKMYKVTIDLSKYKKIKI